MDYSLVKAIHQGVAALSLTGFIARGISVALTRNLLGFLTLL